MKATCTSTRHSEYDCLIRWSVTGGKHHRGLWCQECKDRYVGDYPEGDSA